MDSADIEARLDIIQSLKRKYGRTIEEIITFGQQAGSRLSELLVRSERQSTLDGEIRGAEQAMHSCGEKLSVLRQKRLTTTCRPSPAWS